MTTLRVGVLTISDTASLDPVSDTSGPSLCRLVEAEPRYKVETTAIVADDIKAIQKTVTHWCDDLDLHLVLTTGGTGFGVRDCTPEGK
ncbi:MAG: MoaB/Mog domain-containing protein [Podila humilis]|nr:MAG: MoaB/Mog domain-containing protein [Podila humilis]